MLPLTNVVSWKLYKNQAFFHCRVLKKKSVLIILVAALIQKNVSYYAFETKIKCDGQIPLLFPFRWSLLLAYMYSSSVHVIDKKYLMEPESIVHKHASLLPVNVPGTGTCILRNMSNCIICINFVS